METKVFILLTTAALMAYGVFADPPELDALEEDADLVKLASAYHTMEMETSNPDNEGTINELAKLLPRVIIHKKSNGYLGLKQMCRFLGKKNCMGRPTMAE